MVLVLPLNSSTNKVIGIVSSINMFREAGEMRI